MQSGFAFDGLEAMLSLVGGHEDLQHGFLVGGNAACLHQTKANQKNQPLRLVALAASKISEQREPVLRGIAKGMMVRGIRSL